MRNRTQNFFVKERTYRHRHRGVLNADGGVGVDGLGQRGAHHLYIDVAEAAGPLDAGAIVAGLI